MARKTFSTTIDENLQSLFKKKCKENDDKMNELLESFMKAYIAGEFELEVEFRLKRVKK